MNYISILAIGLVVLGFTPSTYARTKNLARNRNSNQHKEKAATEFGIKAHIVNAENILPLKEDSDSFLISDAGSYDYDLAGSLDYFDYDHEYNDDNDYKDEEG